MKKLQSQTKPRNTNRNFSNIRMERFLILGFIAIAVGNYQDLSAGKPMMMPRTDQLVIQEGNEIKIECYSEGAMVQFSFPERTFMSPRSTHTIRTTRNGTSTFLRRRAVSLDTGWYACAAKGVEIRNDFKNLNHTHEDIAWIYVYVNSSEPFADRYYTFKKPIIVLAESPAIVPCRPTSPDLYVRLWQNSEIVQLSENIQFDPRIGFIIENLVFQDLVTQFYCEVDGVRDRYDLYYSKARGRKPRMKSNVKELTSILEGDGLRMKCYGESKIQFFFPDMNRKTDILSIKTSEAEIKHDENGESTFFRPSTLFGDTGWYGCAEEGINLDISFRYYIDYTRTEINWIYVYVQPPNPRLLGDDEVSSKDSENEVQYEDGSDFLVPCRPTSPSTKVLIKCNQEDEDMQFHIRYGFIVRHNLNNSLMCCRCSFEQLGNSNVFICTRRISEQEKELFVKPGQLILLTGENLRLSYAGCGMYKDSCTRMIIPPAVDDHSQKTMSISRAQAEDNSEVCHTFLAWTLRNVTEHDSIEYSLVIGSDFDVTEKISKFLVVDRKSWEYKKLNLQEDAYRFVRRQNESFRLMVDLQSFSSEKIQWVGPSDQLFEQSVTYDLRTPRFCLTRRHRSLLVINNLTFWDAGVYRMKISTSVGIMVINFTLDVQVRPTTSIINGTQPYYAVGREYFLVSCCAVGSPRPNITWTFLKQPKYPSNNDSALKYPSEYDTSANGTTTTYSHLNTSIDTSGILTCEACNFIGCSAATRRIFLSGSVGRFGIIGPTELPFFGDNVTLKCAASIYAMTKLWWDTKFDECYKNVSHRTFEMRKNTTQFLIQIVLHIKNVTKCHARSYLCSGRTTEGNFENVSYNLQLSVPRKPYFTSIPLGGTRIILDTELDHKKNRTLTCCANGDPRPKVIWFKNDIQLEESPEHHFIPETCQLTVVLDLLDRNSKRYTCKAENRFGLIEDHVEFITKDEKEENKKILFITIAFVLILIGVVIAWFVLHRRSKIRARQKFKDAILARFDKGALNYVQLNVNMAAQAEVLPFDKKWEYPRKLLKFDKILGSGAFGIVRKAEAKSIRLGEKATMVAVKMVRATHRLHYMTALIRELKVLVYLGSHLNIVNLLGACTKNISYGELLVIVEFCRFGNLRDYLRDRRADFIDQIDPVTEEILDSNLGIDRIGTGRDSEQVTDSDDDLDTRNSCHGIDATEKTANANDEALAKGLVQPGLRSQYRSDDPDLVAESICTKDLLCWAWQIVRGMRYLGLRKVVHGDLAARNVLLADNNVVKICDFGLAEILYKDADYKKSGHDLLPLQWMALESIENRMFSTRSDVWSFGIFLWELFTLGETPYYGMNPRHLSQKLRSGYRLSRPKYAPEKIYHMMMNCWDEKPDQRPAFASLEDDLAKQLDNGIHTVCYQFNTIIKSRAQKMRLDGEWEYVPQKQLKILCIQHGRIIKICYCYVTPYYKDMSPEYTELSNDTVEARKIDYLTMDPSQIKTVSFSTRKEEVELGNLPSDECRDSANPSTSHNVLSIVFNSSVRQIPE